MSEEHNFRTVIILNDEVREVLKDDFELFLVFAGMHMRYDWEIHPLHNPDWVRVMQKEEANRLMVAEGVLKHLRETYPKTMADERE